MPPFCRCSISPYEDSEEYEAWLDFLADGGTTESWKKLKEKKRLKSMKLSIPEGIYKRSGMSNETRCKIDNAIRKLEKK